MKGLALRAAGADSNSCLLGLAKASGDGTIDVETGDDEDVFEEACAEGGDTETATGMGEGVFGAESGGVRFLKGGGGVEKFKTSS